MNKREERRLKEEIRYEERHQELDKFNYNNHNVLLFGWITILIAFLILSTEIKVISLKISFMFSLILLIVFMYFLMHQKNKHTNKHFVAREKMIEKRLGNLGISAEKLKTEFTDIYNNS